jgi:hypothetical protein
MPTVAKNVYYRPHKILHPFQVLINKKGAFFSRVYSTLEEAVAGRDAFLTNLGKTSQKTNSQEDCEKTAEELYK